MESITYLKNLKVSPKKMRFVLDEIKKLKPNEALDYLKYTPSKEAKIYYKAVHSAIHNAIITLKVEASVLQFKLFTVEEGRALRRHRAGSRGSAKPIVRRMSHIKLILDAPVEKKQIGKKSKTAKTTKGIAPEKKEAAPKVKKETQKKEVKKEIEKKDVTKEAKKE